MLRPYAPITEWKPYFSQNFWHVKIEPDATNGLTKTSGIDTLQLRGVDLQRFVRRLGNLSAVLMLEVTFAIGAVIEWEVSSD